MPTSHNKKALLLFSGGLDSTTILATLVNQNYEIFAMSFDYGQRHNIELSMAEKTLAKYQSKAKIHHNIVKIDLRVFGGSALTADIAVPKDRATTQENNTALNNNENDIPITYVPARNTIFLAYALALAEVNEIFEIYIGANNVDYSGYPDCRPAYIQSFENMANLATKSAIAGNKIHIKAPLLELTKSEIIKLGLANGADYSHSLSCYDPIVAEDNNKTTKACGHCDSCQLRLRGFANLQHNDPFPYISNS